MNFKKYLPALALLASMGAASSAHATWIDGWNATGTPTEDGELILTVWNEANKRAISVDLGGVASQYIEGTATANAWGLNTADVSWLGNPADLLWNVSAASGKRVNAPSFDNLGYYFTMDMAATTSGVGSKFTLSGFQSDRLKYADYSALLQGLSPDNTQSAVNATVRTEGDLYAGSGTWGREQGGIAASVGGTTDPSFAAADQLMRGFKATWSQAVNNIGNEVTLDTAFVWQLDVANNQLRYMADAPQVPVPAAAWLFGSALLGLVAAVRRRRPV